MFFWIYMTAMAALIPGIMIGFGRMFSKAAPGKINGTFGYRTARSMKSRETWEFAHQKIGILWSRVGAVLLPLSLIAMLPALGKGEDFVGFWGCGVLLVQMLPMIVPICFVEKALKETFDEEGKRK